MNWHDRFIAWSIKRQRKEFLSEQLRDDINSNTSDCSKLLYRLEEAELQIKVNESKLANIERALGPF